MDWRISGLFSSHPIIHVKTGIQEFNGIVTLRKVLKNLASAQICWCFEVGVVLSWSGWSFVVHLIPMEQSPPLSFLLLAECVSYMSQFLDDGCFVDHWICLQQFLFQFFQPLSQQHHCVVHQLGSSSAIARSTRVKSRSISIRSDCDSLVISWSSSSLWWSTRNVWTRSDIEFMLLLMKWFAAVWLRGWGDGYQRDGVLIIGDIDCCHITPSSYIRTFQPTRLRDVQVDQQANNTVGSEKGSHSHYFRWII